MSRRLRFRLGRGDTGVRFIIRQWHHCCCQPIPSLGYRLDQTRIAGMIADRLRESGFEATSGHPDKAPSGVQAIVSYEDDWVYDFSLYLLELRIDFRDPKTNELLAFGQSYHSSLDRKPPEFIVDEIVTTILAGS